MIVLDKLIEDMRELAEKTEYNEDVSTTYKSVCNLTEEYEEILLDNLTEATINMLTNLGICKDINLDSSFAQQIRKQIEIKIECPELTSEDFHNMWLEEMKSEGYTQGDIYSERNLTHPNIVDYKELHKNIHTKDNIIDNLVGAFI